jgi:aryl-alcohol dehydrogenase-like predicted oxidoreductase
VREGLIRHVGVSNYTTAQIEQFAPVRPAETVQPPYDMFRRDIEADLLPYAAAHDMGVLAYGPLAHGLLGGATIGQLAVAWVLAHPAVQVAIVGARTPAHLAESAVALDLELGPDDLAEIDRIMAAAVPAGGPTPEGMS